jgi:vacuolar-type H+-ATPase subunit E/Vma4
MIRSQKQVDMFKARMDAEDAAAKAEAEWLAKNEQGIQDYYAELEKELKNELY